MMRLSFTLPVAFAASLLAASCSTPSAQSLAQNDPWEKSNRSIFAFDMRAYNAVARPVAKGYVRIVPTVAREGLHNFLTNLNSPIVLVNDVLQGSGGKAGDTLGRTAINSTIGVGGLIDVAAKMGIPQHDNDFGITLGKAGAAEGSYLVLPFYGPLPPRDFVGTAADILFDPLTYVSFHGSDTWGVARFGAGVLDDTSSHVDAIDSIERSSIDFYATARNLYRQSRNAQINDDKPALDSLPNL
jgi:phospholipid-binding lipoprotein MlaA